MLTLFNSNMDIKATLLNIILFHEEENRIMCFSFQTLIMLKSKHPSGHLGVPLEKNLPVVKFKITHSNREVLDSDMHFFVCAHLLHSVILSLYLRNAR